MAAPDSGWLQRLATRNNELLDPVFFSDQWGRLYNPSKGKHVLKRAESHRCEVNTLGILACNFSTF